MRTRGLKETQNEKKSVQRSGFVKIGWRLEAVEGGNGEVNGK